MIVYLTGGIGTGKSTVLGLFAELGARTVSADEIVRALYARPSVQEAVARELGLGLPFDRAAVADLVFVDAEARARLESLIHPLVAAELEQRVAVEPETPLVYEIPLLPKPRPGDVVVEVRAPLPLRIQRLIGRGMDRADAERRMAAQPSELEYGKQARFTIVNDGDLSALRAAVAQVWEALRDGPSAV